MQLVVQIICGSVRTRRQIDDEMVMAVRRSSREELFVVEPDGRTRHFARWSGGDLGLPSWAGPSAGVVAFGWDDSDGSVWLLRVGVEGAVPEQIRRIAADRAGFSPEVYGSVRELKPLQFDGLHIDPVREQAPFLRKDPDLPDWLFEELRDRFGLRTTQRSEDREPITRRYYGLARPWYLVILLSPLFGMVAFVLVPGHQRPGVALLVWAIIAILGAFCLVSTGWSYRHLHQPGWLTLLVAALLVENLLRRLER